MNEFVHVEFPTNRAVLVDGTRNGITNVTFVVQRGPHVFELGPAGEFLTREPGAHGRGHDEAGSAADVVHADRAWYSRSQTGGEKAQREKGRREKAAHQETRGEQARREESASTLALGDSKVDRGALRLRRPIRTIEVIDLERTADAVAGEVFEHRERHELMAAGFPGLPRGETPHRLSWLNIQYRPAAPARPWPRPSRAAASRDRRFRERHHEAGPTRNPPEPSAGNLVHRATHDGRGAGAFARLSEAADLLVGHDPALLAAGSKNTV